MMRQGKDGFPEWVCEWHNHHACKLVSDNPLRCKTKQCSLCRCETWHAPGSEVAALARREAVSAAEGADDA